MRHFATVGAAADQPDLRGAALYGRGLCLELARDLEGAKAAYAALQKENAGTRYGGWAEAGLARLARGGRGASAGQAAAKFGPRLDLEGQSRELRKLAGRPALLVFWSPDSKASIDRLLAYRAVWTGTEPREQMLAFAATGDRERIEQVLRRADLSVPMLTCDREFLDEVLLDFAVTGVPDALLLGPDATIVARDPSPAHLVDLLAELRGR